MLSRRRRSVRYLSGPQLPLLVQTVDEPGRQPDVVPHHRPVVSQPVHGADASTQISVDHRSQFTVSELRDQRHVRPRVCVCVCVCVWVSVCLCGCVCEYPDVLQVPARLLDVHTAVKRHPAAPEEPGTHKRSHQHTLLHILLQAETSGVFWRRSRNKSHHKKKKKITAQIHITLSHLLSG